MTFADLGLSDELQRAVNESGYTEPTPIQASAIPSVLMGKDLVAIAQTGTGKTAAFVLPMIDILGEGRSRARMPRSLILEPTRELAAQVAENFEKYGKYHKLSMALLIGGVSMGDQTAALEKGVDVLIATPGRLMDLFGRGKILLTGCSMLVIDEADRMLDMGFIPDIEEICTKLPKTRQTLLFSATMPPPIKKLADKFLDNPKTIEVARPATANVNIKQWLVNVSAAKKRDTLISLLRSEDVQTGIIFSNRKTTVRDLNKALQRAGFASGEIHGDMEQAQRIAELDRFKKGEIKILVASDVAARGIDIKGVSHVFNYDAPWHPDDYVHRIGRTGRAGATGIAFTFATPDDAENIQNIEKLTGLKIERYETGAPVADDDTPEAPREAAPKTRRRPKAAAKVAAAVVDAEDAPSEVERPARTPRPPRTERPAREARAPREERPARASRPPRGAPTERAEPLEPIDAVDDGGWNGPMPNFLLAKLTLTD
ncbi:DEAD/DEAH box helicase [Sphingomonas echinoides]|uniref:DEAD/DEAH box helicase n=1 Tax=Sphingomonas echinoides TaxID=59803 RepID=A0ABU4PIC8_9SPHN|nr:DEAD/DEAH box helicase [Sphingomonas echinoides]MDX5983936.1 DEAD/DEAH box helicase [Sphingomonas echinoides]